MNGGHSAVTYECFAIAAPGLEPLVARELSPLGVGSLDSMPGGVGFRTDLKGLATTQLQLRCASRVIVRLATFRATAFHELERAARKVEWARVLRPGDRFRLRVTCRKSKLYHSDAVAERIAEAIGRAIPGATSTAVAVETDDASETDAADDAQLFQVRLDRDRCTISADASGALLHRRGYRLAVAKAPLRETLAAAMLVGAEWDSARPLVDPFCGSGTIAIEAALRARRMAPGAQRTFAAERWPESSSATWTAAREAARLAELPRCAAPIIGVDRDAGAIEAARANATRAGVADDIEFRCAPLSTLKVPAGPGLLIANPPYGVRVGETEPLRDLYARLGQVAREHCGGWQVAILSADPALEAQTRLDFSTRFRTTNGGIPVRLVVATVRKGSGTRPRGTDAMAGKDR